jgi:hypothetical protein
MTISINSFPDYLGYGIKFKDSYCFNTDTGFHFCRYVFNGETVLEAEISEKEARIRTMFKGVEIGASSDVTLDLSVVKYYKDDDWMKNPIYFAWLNDVLNAGNIYVEVFHKSDFRLMLFPAVYYTTIHIPLKPEKESIAKSIVTNKEYDFFKPWIERGEMTTEYVDKPDETEKIYFLSLLMPIAFAPWLIKKLVLTGVIDTEKRYRAIVGATEFMNGMGVKKYLGTEQDEWMAYGIKYLAFNPNLAKTVS